jgi:hypothetical protein
MKTNNITIMLQFRLIVFSFILLGIAAGSNFIVPANGQDQDPSFQAEIAAVDNMPAQKVKVGDIDIAY